MNAPGSAAQAAQATGAIIIPAHDEEGVISRTLARLRPLLGRPGIDVLVVCNGCTDRTAELARRFAGVTVLEIDESSKPAAMNAGDAATALWPRLYLDADIDVEPDAVLSVFRELASADGKLAGRPESAFDTHRSTWPVRSYYRARARIPEAGVRLWGAGGYAVSRAGHERFPAFAEVTADDSWFDGLFADDEKIVLPTAPMLIRAPETVGALLAILTRHRRGQVEISAELDGSSQRARSILAGVRGPRSAIDAAWYVALALAARARSRAAVGAGTARWETDASTRAPLTAVPATPGAAERIPADPVLADPAASSGAVAAPAPARARRSGVKAA